MKKILLLLSILVIFSNCKDDEVTTGPSLTDYPLTFELEEIQDNTNMTVNLFTQGGEIIADPTSGVVIELSNNIITEREEWLYPSIILHNDGTPSEIVLSENESNAQDDYNPITYEIIDNNYVITTANNIEIQSTVDETTKKLTIPYYSYYKVSSQNPTILRGHLPQSFAYSFIDTTNFIQGDTMATIKYDVIYKLAE